MHITVHDKLILKKQNKTKNMYTSIFQIQILNNS